MLLVICGCSSFAQTSKLKSPRVFLLNSQILLERKKSVLYSKNSDASFKSAIAALEIDAQKVLKTEIASIVTKQANPPSGDKHDYMSQAPYFWKNPQTATGYPYIRRDGERNPEIKQFPDHDLLDKMMDAVETLSTAYYFTGKEEYAAKAGEILQVGLPEHGRSVDPKTIGNPARSTARFSRCVLRFLLHPLG